MKLIDNLTGDPAQLHSIKFGDKIITLVIRYLPMSEIWVATVTYNDRTISGVKLSLGVLHFRSKNFPFDFVVDDESGLSIDPSFLDDFSSKRCKLYLLESHEMEQIRGYPVEL